MALTLVVFPMTPPPAFAITITINQQGMDSCNAPTPQQMQAFWNGTPYYYWNLYIGGSMRSCANSNLTAQWIDQVKLQGWRFLPTWVGPQAACANPDKYSDRMSSNSSEAYDQGYFQAAQAYFRIQDLGIEADTRSRSTWKHPNNKSTCPNAAK